MGHRGSQLGSAVAAAATLAVAWHGAGASEPPTLIVGASPQIFVAKRTGGAHRITSGPSGYILPVWAPDARTLAAGHAPGHTLDIEVVERRDGHQVRHFEGGPDGTSAPAWGPDGHRLAFIAYSRRAGRLIVASVGSGRRRAVVDNAGGSAGWSPDGRRLYYLHGRQALPYEVQQDRSIHSSDPRGRHEHKLVPRVFELAGPSPDGQWLLFVRRSRTGGSAEIWVARADGDDARMLARRAHSFRYGWAPGDRGVYVLGADPSICQHVLVISTSGGRRRLGARIGTRSFAWTPDGARIAWAHEGSVTEVKSSRPDGTDVRTLARFQGSDRIEVGSLTWSKNSRYLAIDAYRHEGD